MQYQDRLCREEDIKHQMNIYLDEHIDFVRRNPKKPMASRFIDLNAPRFYISESKARKIVYSYKRGIPSTKNKRSIQAALHADFYKVFCELEQQNDELPLKERKTTSQLILDAIFSPAPSFYGYLYCSSKMMKDLIDNRSK